MAPIAPPEAPPDWLLELPAHSRLPRLDLGVEWISPWEEFRSSWREFFSGTAAPAIEELPTSSPLQPLLAPKKLSAGAWVASSAWHIVIVLLLALPIWGFLPKTESNLAPVRIEMTWYGTPEDLPKISLPGPAPKPKAPAAVPAEIAQRGADAYHPRETILSEPLHITHPRQTLIQPDAPAAPPKIEVPVPNIVQWAQAAPAKPALPFAPSAAAPRMTRHDATDIAAPEIANNEKTPAPLNIAASPLANQQPKMPLMPTSASVAVPRRTHVDAPAAPAPDVAQNTSSDPNLRRLIAISASPAPPAPEINVPQGNLAARVSISPEGARAGTPGGVGSKPEGAAPNRGGGASSLPAAISVSGGSGRASNSSGGIAPAGVRTGHGLNLKPMTTIPTDPMESSRRGPADLSHLDPSAPPEALLMGKEIHTLHVDLPNLTSKSGSWELHFAQLDETEGPHIRQNGKLSGPEPIKKVDPEYSQEMIKQRVSGEVVLYAIIRKDGSVDSIQLVRGLEPPLDRSAIQAFAQWKFRPGSRDGVPVDLEAIVHVPFNFEPPN
ncbi:MAG: TonB family protein [Candidatus Acidiferrales bacterium]